MSSVGWARYRKTGGRTDHTSNFANTDNTDCRKKSYDQANGRGLVHRCYVRRTRRSWVGRGHVDLPDSPVKFIALDSRHRRCEWMLSTTWMLSLSVSDCRPSECNCQCSRHDTRMFRNHNHWIHFHDFPRLCFLFQASESVRAGCFGCQAERRSWGWD